MKILITGGKGFIGRNLIQMLSTRKEQMILMQNYLKVTLVMPRFLIIKKIIKKLTLLNVVLIILISQ